MVGEVQIVVWYFGPAGQLLASARRGPFSRLMTNVPAATPHDPPFREGKTGHLAFATLQATVRLYVELSSAAKANRLVYILLIIWCATPQVFGKHTLAQKSHSIEEREWTVGEDTEKERGVLSNLMPTR